MIKEITFHENEVGIPVLGLSDKTCWIKWEDEMDIEDILKTASKTETLNKSWESHVWGKNDSKSNCVGPFNLSAYDVICSRTSVKYLLVSLGEIHDFDDIYNCTCLPFNKLNLLKFYVDYLVPFSDKNIVVV